MARRTDINWGQVKETYADGYIERGQLKKYSYRKIAAEFGVSSTAVWNHARAENWDAEFQMRSERKLRIVNEKRQRQQVDSLTELVETADKVGDGMEKLFDVADKRFSRKVKKELEAAERGEELDERELLPIANSDWISAGRLAIQSRKLVHELLHPEDRRPDVEVNVNIMDIIYATARDKGDKDE